MAKSKEAEKPIEIKVNFKKKCKNCGRKGATQSGFCLACIADQVKQDAASGQLRMDKDVKLEALVGGVGDTFPKVMARTKLVSYGRTDKGLTPKFDKLVFPFSVSSKLNNFIDDKEELVLTIQAITSTLKDC
jgi:hypothetical protein